MTASSFVTPPTRSGPDWKSPGRLARLATAALLALSVTLPPLAADRAWAQNLSTSEALRELPPDRKPAWLNPPAYRYAPEGKPDPFLSFVRQEVTAAPRSEPQKSKSGNPLDILEITQIRLTGIIVNPGHPARSLATVEGLDGKAFLLSVGMRIGQNESRVTEITKDTVKFETIETDFLGRKHSRIDALKLRIDDSAEFKE